MSGTGICKMLFDISFNLGTVKVRKLTLQVDTLADGCVGLKLKSFPEFALSYEN